MGTPRFERAEKPRFRRQARFKPGFGGKPAFGDKKPEGFKKKYVGKAAGAKGSYKGGKADAPSAASEVCATSPLIGERADAVRRPRYERFLAQPPGTTEMASASVYSTSTMSPFLSVWMNFFPSGDAGAMVRTRPSGRLNDNRFERRVHRLDLHGRLDRLRQRRRQASNPRAPCRPRYRPWSWASSLLLVILAAIAAV